jgi:hypothetical protein
MNTIALKEYFEHQLAGLRDQLKAFKELMEERDRRYGERFQSTDEKTGLALTSSEKAVTKAEVATEKRFDSVNEFRGSLKDQAATLIPRVEADARFKTLEDKIEDLKKAALRNVLTIVGILIAAAGLLIKFGK